MAMFSEISKVCILSEITHHTFSNTWTGVESQAVVEFAPYPKIPTEKRKPDTRNATIEKGLCLIVLSRNVYLLYNR